ncbi:MAG TPA: MFS transporter [Solirubrobacteraceae bacterium]|nr:MFS transporter [Solirubrobacteraceae bacterium]
MKSVRGPVGLGTVVHLCVGLFGVQIVWGLQNANTSRLFQSLGADVGQLAVLWIAGPATGALVQPMVGYLSDRSRSRWGRRRPFILVGALTASAALVLFVHASSLAIAAALLWLLCIGANLAMEPLRALTGDLVPEDQRNRAFALQAAFIAAGAVVSSALPWVLGHGLGIASQPVSGAVPESVRLAFWFGALALLATIGWTVAFVHETPGTASFPDQAALRAARPAAGRLLRRGAVWLGGGTACAFLSRILGLRQELYVLAAFAVLYGLSQLWLSGLARRGRHPAGLLQISEDIVWMPPEMKRLAVVQFFTWLGLFTLWVYTVPAVAEHRFGSHDPASAHFHDAADWVGVLYAMYNAFAIAAAPLVARASARWGRSFTHGACLAIGAVGILGLVTGNPHALPWLPSMAIGVAWSSILSLPYAIVASASPASKMGVNMGIHNLFLVVPQLVGAVILGPLLDSGLGGSAVGALKLAALLFAVGGLTSIVFGALRSK